MSEENKEYLVRGAQLVCHMGSHIRRYNLPESHGAYVMNHPLVTKTDVGPDNIKFFGVCFSENPPEAGNVVRYEGGYDEEGKPAEDVQGIQCCPCFTTAEWQEVHGNSVTMQSYLMCKCGGMVYPLSSGIEYED